MAYLIGQLRHRLVVQRLGSSAPDEAGGCASANDPAAWQEFCRVWASVEPVSQRELYFAQQVNARATHRIKMRGLTGLTPTMRLKFGERVFTIERIANSQERGIELVVYAVEVTA